MHIALSEDDPYNARVFMEHEEVEDEDSLVPSSEAGSVKKPRDTWVMEIKRGMNVLRDQHAMHIEATRTMFSSLRRECNEMQTDMAKVLNIVTKASSVNCRTSPEKSEVKTNRVKFPWNLEESNETFQTEPFGRRDPSSERTSSCGTLQKIVEEDTPVQTPVTPGPMSSSGSDPDESSPTEDPPVELLPTENIPPMSSRVGVVSPRTLSPRTLQLAPSASTSVFRGTSTSNMLLTMESSIMRDRSRTAVKNSVDREVKTTKSESSLGFATPRKEVLVAPLRRSSGSEIRGKSLESGRPRGGTPLCSPRVQEVRFQAGGTLQNTAGRPVAAYPSQNKSLSVPLPLIEVHTVNSDAGVRSSQNCCIPPQSFVQPHPVITRQNSSPAGFGIMSPRTNQCASLEAARRHIGELFYESGKHHM